MVHSLTPRLVETPEQLGARFAREEQQRRANDDTRLERLKAELFDGLERMRRECDRMEAAIRSHLGGAA